jgi:phytoene desaturase
MEYSCSTFMLYLGVKKKYEIPHHNVVFADDYHRNLREITEKKALSDDPSFYIQNASITDPTLAPPGCSAIYVLVPVPNRTAEVDWNKEKEPFRRRVLDSIMRKTELTDLEKNIEVERVITPLEWERGYHVYNGATFNLAHTIDQMLYFRPHNRLEGYRNFYMVGGGTHPGSGLPTIYMSGKIAAELAEMDLS